MKRRRRFMVCEGSAFGGEEMAADGFQGAQLALRPAGECRDVSGVLPCGVDDRQLAEGGAGLGVVADRFFFKQKTAYEIGVEVAGEILREAKLRGGLFRLSQIVQRPAIGAAGLEIAGGELQRLLKMFDWHLLFYQARL